MGGGAIKEGFCTINRKLLPLKVWPDFPLLQNKSDPILHIVKQNTHPIMCSCSSHNDVQLTLFFFAASAFTFLPYLTIHMKVTVTISILINISSTLAFAMVKSK